MAHILEKMARLQSWRLVVLRFLNQVMLRTKRFLLKIIPTNLAGRLRAWRIHQLIRAFPCRIVEHIYGNAPLKVYLSDPLAEGWYDHDWAELPEIMELRKTSLRPGARVFDIGAHQGVVALMLAREVQSSGLVVAVEPNQHNKDAIDKNRALNGMGQISTVQAAISDVSGTLTFNEGLNGQIDDGSGSGGCTKVEAITIDDLATRFGLPDLVFLDVEGAEEMALRGAKGVLTTGADFFVEIHIGCGLEKLGGSVAGLLSYFRSDQFKLYIKAEADEAFHPLLNEDPVLQSRCFLLAILDRQQPK